MKRVLVLGSTGMLGSEVCKVLSPKYAVVKASRVWFDVEAVCKSPQKLREFFDSVEPVDWVINAIGVTIAQSKQESTASTFLINSVLPHILAQEYGNRLIHITTDCVYSGKDENAPYTEDSILSPTDVYGLSKSLGEPQNCITLRTSIIGRGGDGTGLLEWFLAQKTSVNGFRNHFWNGITTKQFGLVCDQLISANWNESGIFHVFSDVVSKYEMLLAFKEKFGSPCQIVPTNGHALNRTLATVRPMNAWLQIPSFQQMIEEM
jgi:dTDP-4-dehydrorhamnose reductase